MTFGVVTNNYVSVLMQEEDEYDPATAGMDLVTIGDNDDDDEVYDPESAFADDAGTLAKQPPFTKKKIRVEILDSVPAPTVNNKMSAPEDDPQFSDDESGRIPLSPLSFSFFMISRPKSNSC